MKRILILCLISFFVFSGCSWFSAKEEKAAQELATEGMHSFKNENYRQAVESFEKLKDWYPFSKFAILAELKIADAHYNLGEYEDAIFAYEEFENLHPNNEAIPYIIYQIGMCYFEQVSTPDRDQNSAEKAKLTFMRLIKQFPGDKYAHMGKAHIKKCDKSLAEAVFKIGLHYYKSKHYKAALARFRSVITDGTDVGMHYKALQYITQCEALIKENSN